MNTLSAFSAKTKKDRRIVNKQKRHSTWRAWERYRLTLTEEDYTDVIRQILFGHACFIEKDGNRIEKYLVSVQNKPCIVAYDKKHRSIASFLPENTWFTSTFYNSI